MKVRDSFPLLIAYVFQNHGGLCNYHLQEEEAKHQLFGLICKGARFWLFAGSLWSFVGNLWSLADILWLFAGGL